MTQAGTKELLIHIGFPKTGTTTLQAHLFTQVPELSYFGKFDADEAFAPQAAPWIRRFREVVNHADDFHATRQGPEIGAQIRDTVLAEATPRSLISLEGITNPFVDLSAVQPKDIYRKAHHMAEVLAPATEAGIRTRILISLRPQTALLPSLFSQIYYHGFASGLYGNSFASFLDFMFEDQMIGQGPALYFDQLADCYAGLFGAENVTCVDMRGLFGGAQTDDIARLADLLSCPAETIPAALAQKKSNVRKTTIQGAAFTRMMVNSPAARRLKERTGMDAERHAFSLMDRIKLRRGKPVLWKMEPQTDRIAAYYAASNARLAERYGIDLG